MNTEDLVRKTKILLGINDCIQDEVLTVLVEDASFELITRLNKYDRFISFVPEELSFIVTTVAQRRFLRLSDEGRLSSKDEAFSVTYNYNDFKDFEDIILDYVNYEGCNSTIIFW